MEFNSCLSPAVCVRDGPVALNMDSTLSLNAWLTTKSSRLGTCPSFKSLRSLFFCDFGCCLGFFRDWDRGVSSSDTSSDFPSDFPSRDTARLLLFFALFDLTAVASAAVSLSNFLGLFRRHIIEIDEDESDGAVLYNIIYEDEDVEDMREVECRDCIELINRKLENGEPVALNVCNSLIIIGI